ncbi:MAG: hypothetical protein AAF196_03670 [Planctomycetota bacterium]
MNPRVQSLIARVPLLGSVSFFVLFVVAPIVAMYWQTFWYEERFTFELWGDFLQKPDDREAIWKSIRMGLLATGIAGVVGTSLAWFTTRTDLPGRSIFAVFGVAPLVVPPIVLAMSWSDFADMNGFFGCSSLLAISNTPFVYVLARRGLTHFDGHAYEAARLARGRSAAERMLLRSALPEIGAGCLFAFVFVVCEHGTPEFLTVKGKTWITYAERVYGLWGKSAIGVDRRDLLSPIIASLPLVLLILTALFAALQLRARTDLRSDPAPLPTRSLRRLRPVGVLTCVAFLGVSLIVPLVVMVRWGMGSTQKVEPMSIARLQRSFEQAYDQDLSAVVNSLTLGVFVAITLVLFAWPLARATARRRGRLEGLSLLGLAVPVVLFGSGQVLIWNSSFANDVLRENGVDLYDSFVLVVLGFAGRFLPFAVLTLCTVTRRVSPAVDEAARSSGRGPVARALRLHLPLGLPAAASAAYLGYVLALRELDLAAMLPAGNDTVVRRVSNIVHFGGEEPGSALILTILLAAILPAALHWILTGRRMRGLS